MLLVSLATVVGLVSGCSVENSVTGLSGGCFARVKTGYKIKE